MLNIKLYTSNYAYVTVYFNYPRLYLYIKVLLYDLIMPSNTIQQ